MHSFTHAHAHDDACREDAKSVCGTPRGHTHLPRARPYPLHEKSTRAREPKGTFIYFIYFVWKVKRLRANTQPINVREMRTFICTEKTNQVRRVHRRLKRARAESHSAGASVTFSLHFQRNKKPKQRPSRAHRHAHKASLCNEAAEKNKWRKSRLQQLAASRENFPDECSMGLRHNGARSLSARTHFSKRRSNERKKDTMSCTRDNIAPVPQSPIVWKTKERCDVEFCSFGRFSFRFQYEAARAAFCYCAARTAAKAPRALTSTRFNLNELCGLYY